MQQTKAHIIIIDGPTGSGRKTLCFELALALLYNNQKTALVLSDKSALRNTLINRTKDSHNLPMPELIERKDFAAHANDYDAIIIPETGVTDELAEKANTFITLVPQNKTSVHNFPKNLTYINGLWELKKKIAAKNNRSLNWIVCENNTKAKNTQEASKELTNAARMYGFRITKPLNCRNVYRNNIHGISALDKSSPKLQNKLTYEDICAKREIIKLAEFIFS